MATIKKIILFLFGIVLIVFGNKAAIDTMFKTDEGLKTPEAEEKESESPKPVITQELEEKKVEEAIVPTPIAVSEKEIKKEHSPKKETPKTTSAKNTETKTEPKPLPKEEKTEVKEVAKEAEPVTTIEPVQEESAEASE